MQQVRIVRQDQIRQLFRQIIRHPDDILLSVTPGADLQVKTSQVRPAGIHRCQGQNPVTASVAVPLYPSAVFQDPAGLSAQKDCCRKQIRRADKQEKVPDLACIVSVLPAYDPAGGMEQAQVCPYLLQSRDLLSDRLQPLPDMDRHSLKDPQERGQFRFLF